MITYIRTIWAVNHSCFTPDHLHPWSKPCFDLKLLDPSPALLQAEEWRERLAPIQLWAQCRMIGHDWFTARILISPCDFPWHDKSSWHLLICQADHSWIGWSWSDHPYIPHQEATWLTLMTLSMFIWHPLRDHRLAGVCPGESLLLICWLKRCMDTNGHCL